MTTLKEVLTNTTWAEISTNMEPRQAYEYSKYRHNLESIYHELKALHTVNPIMNNIELHVKDLKWGFKYYVKFGETSLDIKYLPWEIILGITVNEETLNQETKENIIMFTLNELFHYGKTKEMSDVNINWMYRAEWLVYTECIPVPFVILKNKDNSRKNMTGMGKGETMISRIYNPNTEKDIYVKDIVEYEEAI